MCDVRPLENHRFRSKSVEIRRVHFCASVASDGVRSLLVRQKKNQIGLSMCGHILRSRTKSALMSLCNRLALARSFRRRDSRVSSNQFQRASEQFFPWGNLVPGRCAGGMRKRNHVEGVSCSLDTKPAADHSFQLRAIDELRDSQPTDGNDEARPQNFDFIIHPGRAIANLLRSRNTICTARIFSGKTAADRGEIDFRSDGGFVHPAEFFEPAKKRLASCMRKRSLQNWLSWAGRLTNDHYIAHDCAARDGRGFHARATAASEQ